MPRLFYPRERDPVPIVYEAVTNTENLVPTGVRSPDRPARGESLYRLRHLEMNM